MEMLHLKDLGPPQRTYGTIARSGGFMPSPTRSYGVHEVRPEDTLAGLALKYDVTVQELRRTNSLWANDNVWPGQVLRVPLQTTSTLADTPSSASTTSTSTSSSSASTATSSSSGLHTPPGRRKDSDSSNDPTLQEYLNRLDRSIAQNSKEATKDLKKEGKGGSSTSRKQHRASSASQQSSEAPVC